MPSAKVGKDPKAAALLRDGTLNPSPEKVADPKFREYEFFDPRDVVQVKYEMLRRVIVEKASVTDATDQYGVSRPTYYEAKAHFDDAGVAGLVPKKRGPRGPHKLQGELLAFVEKQHVPGEPIRARELALRIRQQFSIEVHPRTIERALAVKKLHGEAQRRSGGGALGYGNRSVREATDSRSRQRWACARSEKRPRSLPSTRHVGMGSGGARYEHAFSIDVLLLGANDRAARP